jgi:peptidoglycan pentaglycine glycine transferase (the first glycine)
MIDVALSGAEEAWDHFVAGHPYGHVLQTSRWARLKTLFGWKSEIITLCDTSSAAPIRAGSSLLFRRLPWGQTVAYAPKGPLVDWNDPGQVEELLFRLRDACRKCRAALLKIEPDLPDSALLADRLQAYGFARSAQRVQPLSTIQIDLTGDAESILACMKPKWRYNIRLAERKGVTVKLGSMADLPAIQALLQVTGERDGFGVHSAAYYQAATELFGPANMATWLVAEHEGEMLAAIAVFALGRHAWYMWGASADHGRNLMPNHALQWAAMEWARARGCQIYDLWGIPDEVGARPEVFEDPDSWGEGGLWGVYRFKQGFGGRVVRFAGAWDLPISRAGEALYRLGLRVRRPSAE